MDFQQEFCHKPQSQQPLLLHQSHLRWSCHTLQGYPGNEIIGVIGRSPSVHILLTTGKTVQIFKFSPGLYCSTQFLIRLKSNDISTIAIIHFESPFLIFLTWQNVLNECKSNRIGIKVFWTKNFLGKANVVRGLLTILLQISKIFCPSKTFLWFFNLINFFKTCFFWKTMILQSLNI